MKAIACAIMFAAILHIPMNVWNEFTDTAKLFVAMFVVLMWCGFLGFLSGEKS